MMAKKRVFLFNVFKTIQWHRGLPLTTYVSRCELAGRGLQLHSRSQLQGTARNTRHFNLCALNIMTSLAALQL
jgi:hypothetical protein